MIDKNTQFLGYRRQNGAVGVRNHVIILPVDDISNAACDSTQENFRKGHEDFCEIWTS